MSTAPFPPVRIGQGYDVHAFGEGDHIMLGGVNVPHSCGVLAHSDGDVILHALCDAMLGALALGDIGQHFPPSDDRWKGADSSEFVRHCDGLLRERGWRVGNTDITVICERPKVGPHALAMRERIGGLLQLPLDAVSVKATTSEKLGFTGRGEGIAAQAVVLLVDELPAFEATGEGEHLLLHIRKRGANTVHVAKLLAAWAGLPEMAVSYAGMKDRHAVTTQRFSVHLPKRIAPDLAALASDEIEVLDATWHNRKLQRGALAGNRFKLVLRDVKGDRAAISERLQQIAERGLPNWFGEQRFGRDGGNVPAALAMFGGRRMRKDQRSLLLSAARSALFNRVLAARVEQGSWDQPLDGEVWMLDGSRSVFGPEPYTDVLAERLARFDIHPSAPLWGEGELRSTDAARELELAALDDEESKALRAGLEDARLKQERRALRLRPALLQHVWLADDVLELSFALPPGCYATAVLHELGPVEDASQA
ncbi:hypothetical protein G6F35_007304 [Rhizopus arrhizus]|nr:hypothetical protein G6F35_007304 [Rhizopus arrhizus]